MRKIIFLSLLMILGLTGMAQAAEGCRCGTMIGVLQTPMKVEVSCLIPYGEVIMQVYQGGSQQNYYLCDCDDSGEEGVCKTTIVHIPPSTLYWHYYDSTHAQKSAFAPCRWYTTTEGLQCGNYGC